jgi:hypothetical protein
MWMAPNVVEHDREFFSLEMAKLLLVSNLPELELLAQIDEQERIPIRLARHVRRAITGAVQHFLKSRMFTGPPHPMTGILKIAFPAVDHAMPVSCRVAFDLLRFLVTIIESVMIIVQSAPQ